MDTTDQFNVSSKDDELQKNIRDDALRAQEIEKIKDVSNRRKAFTMMEARDHDLKTMRDSNQEKRDKAIEEQERKLRPEAQMHLRPKNAPTESLESRRKHIEKTVNQTMGKEHAKQEREFLNSRNSDIDKFIDKNRNPNRKQEFSKNASDITGKKRSDETSQDYKNRTTLTGEGSTSRNTSASRQQQRQAARDSSRSSARSTGRGGRSRSRSR